MMTDSPLLLMPQAASDWPRLALSFRQDLLRAASEALLSAWRQGHDVTEFPLALLAFTTSGDRVTASLPPLPGSDSFRKPSIPLLQAALADWFSELIAFATPDEARFFARSLLVEQPQDQAAFHAGHAETRAQDAMRRQTLELYRHYLGAGGKAPRHGLRAHWDGEPMLSPLDLHAELQAAESAPGARVVKAGRTIHVIQTTLRGRTVMIKRYRIQGWWQRLKYRLRPSRARRAWAAASTLQSLGIPTPRPLGFLEVIEDGVPVYSYSVTEWVTGADTAYRWVKHAYRRLSLVEQAAARAEIAQALMRLYGKGLYHGDTKLMNLLVREGPEAGRTWMWIDLECMDAGCAIDRRRILRNLVQLNGSARHWIPEADRLDFLAEMARQIPCLQSPGLADIIRNRSRKRQLRELSRRTPPDGVSRS